MDFYNETRHSEAEKFKNHLRNILYSEQQIGKFSSNLTRKLQKQNSEIKKFLKNF